MTHFQFRRPSEHVVNGHRFPLEMQLVHKNDWDDGMLIVSVLFEEGQTNEFLEKLNFGSSGQIPGGITPLGALEPSLLQDTPQAAEVAEADEQRLLRREKCEQERSNPQAEKGILGGSLAGVDTRADLLCIDRIVEASSKYKYWTYSGSLPAPPCTEGVKWLVLQEFATASPAQVIALPALRLPCYPHPLRSAVLHTTCARVRNSAGGCVSVRGGSSPSRALGTKCASLRAISGSLDLRVYGRS
jgi:hypothetical protein